MPDRAEQPAAPGAARPETVGDKAARLRNKPTLTAHDHLERLEELAGVRQAFQRITEAPPTPLLGASMKPSSASATVTPGRFLTSR